MESHNPSLCLSKKVKLSPIARGLDYSTALGLLAVTCKNQVLLVDPDVCDSEPLECIDSLHGCPSLVRFSLTRGSDSCILVSDNEGPIDVIDVETKGLVRSYLEHSDSVTGLDWTSDNACFVSC